MTAPGAPPGPAGGPPAVGGLADEAAQLLDALATRLALARVTVGAAGPADPGSGSGVPRDGDPVGPVPGPPDAAGGHTQCVGWCPVCRAADLLRGERPEVAGKLVDSAIVVVNALRSLLPAMPTDGQAAAGPSTASGPSGDTAPPQPGIERIDIR